MNHKYLLVIALVLLSQSSFSQKYLSILDTLEKKLNADVKRSDFLSAYPTSRKINNTIILGIGQQVGKIFPKKCGDFEKDTLVDTKSKSGFVDGEIDVEQEYYLPGKNPHLGAKLINDSVKFDPADPSVYVKETAVSITDPAFLGNLPLLTLTINNSAMAMQAVTMVHSSMPGQGPQNSPAEVIKPIKIKGYRAMVKDNTMARTKEIIVLVGATTISAKLRDAANTDLLIKSLESIDFNKIKELFGE
ncbi:MAG: hypothetical protein JWO03_791 [Bacteroidetes bacterium]|nr:hypothetical protein [Bacteroidota bacterium]